MKINPDRAISVWRALLVTIFTFPAWALAIDWPQEVTADGGTIVVYQPQPEGLSGNILKGRAAMSLELDGRDEPIFGAFWFDARIDTDHDAGTAVIRDITITNVRWPESTDASEQRFTTIVEAAIPETGFEISMERLSSSLASAADVQKSLDGLKNDPPVILFENELAVLLMYDGEARYADIDDSPYERVLNTPFAVVRKKGSNDFFLSSGKFWYQASAPLGPWSATTSPPGDLVRMLENVATDDEGPDSPPLIVAADEPTELIVTDGAPDWQSLPGGELLYVKNTETAWLRELSTNNMYLLLSGRWFRAKSQDGPWSFVRADELPESFSAIPPASDIGGLRSSVAGTEEANDALLDAQIPQTAAIERDKASLAVEYDGAPKFEPISGTAISYAVNTAAQVLLIEGRYYAVDNGVWFVSADATGPWVVADSVPQDEIAKIPPSSPMYNTTHVHIYEATPEVVYVGYTPGYMWSFPYYGVPVYGTGWYYPPYYGGFYYPRPPTWGFHVGYNPWTGWNYGVSWSNGFFTMGVSWGGGYGGGYYPGRCCGGYYGGGYRGPVVINTGDINIGNNVNIGNRTNIKNNIDRGGNANLDRARNNIYNRGENQSRVADRATAQRDLKQARPATTRQNDVYADRNGNVAKRTNNGWESRQDGQWQRDNMPAASRDTRQRTPSAAQSRDFDRGGLDRSYQTRQHGTNRQMSRPTRMRQAPRRRR